MANGVLYLTLLQADSVIALDARTGASLWTYTGSDQTGIPVSPPVIANGVLYVVGGTGDHENPTGVAWAFHLPGQ